MLIFTVFQSSKSNTARPESSFKYAEKLFPVRGEMKPSILWLLPVSRSVRTFAIDITREQITFFIPNLHPFSRYPLHP